MVDLYTPVGAARNDSLYVAACEIGADGVGIITLVGEQRIRGTPARRRNMGADRGAVDAVVAAVSHDLGVTETASQTPASLRRRNRR